MDHWIDSRRHSSRRGSRIRLASGFWYRRGEWRSVAADHFSDATDLTALPFDQLPTTFSIALPFLHRPLIVGGEETWQRRLYHCGQDTEKERERTRAAKETARPRWKDVYTAQQRGKRREAFVRTESPRSVASGRIKAAFKYARNARHRIFAEANGPSVRFFF
jgi:hypothetical protein